VLLELHVADDVGADRAGRVRQRRASEARMKFLCDGCTAGLRSALEDQRLMDQVYATI
jgi:hypothetical protein